MIKAHLLSPWSITGDMFHPAVTEDYTLITWTDVTGQDSSNLTPDPNMYVIVAIMDDAVYEVLEADQKYEILTSEEYIRANT